MVELGDLGMMLLPLWVHKVLVVPLEPVGLALVVAGVGVVWKKRWLVWAGLGVLGVLSMRVTGDALLRPLEGAYAGVEVGACPEADAAVVLGGVLSRERGGRQEWNDAVDRFEGGLALLGAGRVRAVVFTRAKAPWGDGGEEGEVLREAALRRGVTAERIVLTEGLAGNTEDEAREVRGLMAARGWRRVVVVTSAFHMRRAMGLMARSGVAAVAFPVDYRGVQAGREMWTDWLPNAEGMANSELAMKEYWGLAYYGVR